MLKKKEEKKPAKKKKFNPDVNPVQAKTHANVHRTLRGTRK
ncbi:MAG TPA: hypothetical protein VK622_10675 [Puia sp.]|nr:hypothetical protein [Puia sp.]